MTIMTHTVECGPLGEVELTVSYRYSKGRRQPDCEPAEGETVTIGWIKIGGYTGVEVNPSDDYIDSEIIPDCVAHWHGEAEAAAEARADMLREERSAA